jgi:ATP-binding cassette subfamily B protein
VMFQDYASYDFVTKDAIAIGRPDKPTNLTRVVEAAHTSQSHTFIEEWKDKYDQQLGVEFGGKEPSKGQRQKLSIAKILYRNGFVMVLDEPTASVDAESEAKIFDSIESLSKETTAILISHDFSTISQCDKIFVLDKGTLKEEGSHKELMKMKSLYAELYNLQAKRFKK